MGTIAETKATAMAATEKTESAWREAWMAVRRNLVPMLVLWGLAVLFLVVYYLVPGGAELFGPLVQWQLHGGKLAAFLNRVLFIGILPGIFLVSVKSIRPRHPMWTVVAYTLWG